MSEFAMWGLLLAASFVIPWLLRKHRERLQEAQRLHDVKKKSSGGD